MAETKRPELGYRGTAAPANGSSETANRSERQEDGVLTARPVQGPADFPSRQAELPMFPSDPRGALSDGPCVPIGGVVERGLQPDDFDSLLVAARDGAPWAWQQLFDELAGKVAGYLRVQGAVDVDDLVSEVFIGVFRNIASFEGSGEQFRSWVFVIAHRRLVDERRRRGRSPVDPLGDLQEHGGQFDDDAAETALTQMSAQRVVTLCDRLVPDQRDVLLLRIVTDLTIEQIAEVVGKSEGAVKALQRRGLAALRRIISREGVPL
jgi:RNA polymerase sigma factor (sigma-70 family)